ncbi:MAG: PAS domain S-box protein, partial [Proteobacteria bacterium]|nr:PAS domain S-box protein [Pseudomonadota bacterium]
MSKTKPNSDATPWLEDCSDAITTALKMQRSCAPGDLIPFRLLVEQSLAGIYVIQGDYFRYCNDVYANCFGYKPADLVGQRIEMIAADNALDEVRENIRKREAGEAESIRYITNAKHRNGSEIWCEVHGSRLEYLGKPAVMGVSIDITDRIRRERELMDKSEQLRALTRHVNDLREIQRTEIAREVHDGLGGILTSLKIETVRLSRRLQNPSEQEVCATIGQLAQSGIDEIRRISRELRPVSLDHLGLLPAITEALAECASRYHIAASVCPGAHGIQLPDAQASSIYRIFQEALTNVARHARASAVKFDMRRDSGRL